jgi:predicted ATP-grasp superfamily ATP-dependent carboligase
MRVRLNTSYIRLKMTLLEDDSPPKILICATLWWPSSARLAMAFLRHHCKVTALCPKGHPLRFVRGIDTIYDYQGLTSIRLLRAAIRAAKPTLIVPCDDVAVWQLQALHASETDLRPLIELSIGAAAAYPLIQHRAEVLRVAQSLGVRVPLTCALNSAEDLKDWKFDKPAVLKMDGTWGGEGVTVVHSRTEAIQTFHAAPDSMKTWRAWKRYVVNRHYFAFWTWGRRETSKMTIQQFIPGRPATTMFACWRGEVLASSTVEVLISQAPTGAANVVRVIKHDEIENAVRLLARKLQLSGFHGLDFVLEQDTEAAYLLELNPRATQLGHLNLSVHGDLAGVMAGKLKNEAPRISSESEILNGTIAFFPHAFKTNPDSVYLHQGYHDVPWEQPALVRELLGKSWPERQWQGRLYGYLSSHSTSLHRQPDSLRANSESRVGSYDTPAKLPKTPGHGLQDDAIQRAPG